MAAPSRTRAGRSARTVLWLTASAVVVVLALWPGAVHGQPGATRDPMEVALDRTFGAVSVTETIGGPPHSGREPDEWANFPGTKDGTRGVLYRTDQRSCPAEDDYQPPCSQVSTWLWDGRGRSWAESPGATQPGGRMAASAAAMPEGLAGQSWIYSGNDHQSSTSAYDAKTWILGDDGQWSPAPCNPGCAVTPIDGSVGAASATDSLLFGGDYAGPPPVPPFFVDDYTNEVFRWSGTDWQLLPAQGARPGRRAAGGFAYDGRDFILFGGGYVGPPTTLFPQGVGDFADTWRLHEDASGTWSWSLVCQQCGPVGRHQGTMAGLYRVGDARRGALLVGGQAFRGAANHEYALSDVWAWNGETWTQIEPVGAPCDVTPPEAQPCWSDPTVRFAPFSASLPALGAAVFTTGSCTATMPPEPVVPTPALAQVCERVTTQVVLEDPQPAPVTTTTAPARPPASAPPAPSTTPAPAVAPALPATGANRSTGVLLATGLVSIAVGVTLVAVARRRRAPGRC